MHYWFKSYADFAEWVDFDYWWSCIRKGLRLQPAQQAGFQSSMNVHCIMYMGGFTQGTNDLIEIDFCHEAYTFVDLFSNFLYLVVRVNKYQWAVLVFFFFTVSLVEL